MARKFKSWISGLAAYIERTEAPRIFWRWGAISTIASALQRKVWLPFGIENYYPNLYILLVGPPASRKGAPVIISRRLLKDIEVSVAVDSSSKRAFTMELEETAKKETYYLDGKPHAQCAISICSTEMSSLLAVNPKEMIEVLTDIYDSPDTWDYKTRGQDEDRLYNVCVNCLIATTPTWLAANLPQEAIGGGYTSRHVVVYGERVYQRVTIPGRRGWEDLHDGEVEKRQERIYADLVNDLLHISQLTGEFKWTEAGFKLFDSWYQAIDDKFRACPDERLHPFIGRMHACVIKTAMCLRVDWSDELLLDEEEIKKAIEYLEQVLSIASDAFAGHGRSRLGVDQNRVMDQLSLMKVTTLRELMSHNYRHLTLTELKEVLQGIATMGLVSLNYDTGEITWIGDKGRKQLK